MNNMKNWWKNEEKLKFWQQSEYIPSDQKYILADIYILLGLIIIRQYILDQLT